MRFAGRMKFSTKLNLGMSLIVLMVAVLLAVFSINIASRALLQESKRSGQILAHNLALRAVDPLLSMDFLQLKNMVDEVVSVDKDVVYAFILDNKGQVLANSFFRGFPVDLAGANKPGPDNSARTVLIDTGREMIYDFAVPVTIDSKMFGTARMGLSRTNVQKVVRGMIMTITGLTVLALIVASFVSTQFAKRITKRLYQLRKYAEEIVKGNLDLQTGPTLKHNCWEMMACDRLGCPAYGDTKHRCWYLAGTLCEDEHAAKGQESCSDCPVYRQSVGDEIQDLAETFDVMSNSLHAHIEELKATQKDLTDQQQLLRTILDATPDMVSLIGRDMKYLSVNKTFADFAGVSLERLRQMTCRDVYTHDLAEEFVRENRKVIETGTGFSRECRLTPKGRDEEKWYHIVKVPVFGRSGDIIALLSTARDVTETKSYQAQLLQSQKMESVGKLAGGVAHEINTPLGIILGYSQLLQEDVAPDSQIFSDLKIIEKQTKFCRKIVSDLLGFSRQTSSDKIELCFNNSIMEVVQLVRHTFKLSGVEIITDLDDRFPIIFGSPEKLKQVWLNLLSNAMEATEKGGIIKIVTRLDTGKMRITALFGDTGGGISPKNLSSIFDPFFSTKPVGKGTGLGLSVSFGIIEDHQGTITADSPASGFFTKDDLARVENPGPGTVFKVVLPLEHAPDPHVA